MRVGDMQSCKCYNLGLKDMVLKLSGTHRQPGGGPRRRGGSPPPTRTTSLYRSGYYRPGVVQDDMAVPPATYLGHGHGGGASSTASSTPAWERPPGNGDAAARGEWVAQVEPGVQITFVSLSGTGGGAGGGNDLKRIRFSREMYDKWQAQRWWAENNERIMELYNVRRFSPRHDHVLPPSSDAAALRREAAQLPRPAVAAAAVVVQPVGARLAAAEAEPAERRRRGAGEDDHLVVQGRRRVRQQRQRARGHRVGHPGPARRLHHRPRAPRRRPRAPPRPIQP